MIQMLLCVFNGVGYINYLDNVVQSFVVEVVKGIDVFCVFDSFNWVENMCVVMDVVVESGKICEGMVCYIGDIFDLNCVKYDIKYYVGMVKEFEVVGVYVLGFKDMVGLLKLVFVCLLICVLKEEIGLLIYFYIYDILGIVGVIILVVVDVGVDVVDVVMDVFFGGMLQFCMGLIVEVLCNMDCDMGFDIKVVCEISDYWEVVCGQYIVFESGFVVLVFEVYLYEMSGGQFINFKVQVCSLGFEECWYEVVQIYVDVNQMFGDIVKVILFFKVVGDMVLMMVS